MSRICPNGSIQFQDLTLDNGREQILKSTVSGRHNE